MWMVPALCVISDRPAITADYLRVAYNNVLREKTVTKMNLTVDGSKVVALPAKPQAVR